MIKRFALLFLIVAIVLGGLGYFKFKQIRAAIAEGENFQLPPEAITTYTVTEQEWELALEAIGSVVAVNGVQVSADLPGLIKAIHFESGAMVKTGDLLAELDTTQEEAEKAAAEARLELAGVNLKRAQELVSKRAAAQSDLDTARAEFDQAKAALREVEARISRKTIRAPFDGKLGIREANLGQYLNPGDAVVVLDSLDPIRVRFFVPQQVFDRVRGTREVEVTGAGLDGQTIRGQVTAVNSRIDTATRNVLVEATFANEPPVLRPGMFVEVRAVMPEEKKVLAIPASAVSYAPYGDSVFVVRELTGPDGQTYEGVEQVFVTLGSALGDLVAVEKGVQAGEVIASSGVFKLRPKSAIFVNNAVQPGAERDPAVPDT